MTTPEPSAATYGWPNWIRRSIIGALLVGCAALLVYGNRHSIVGKAQLYQSPVIVEELPAPGGNAPRQGEIGANLKPGYDGRLTINGISIPEGQMVGARDPSGVDPQDLKQNGLRPNNRNSVFFQPGPGKVITKLDGGTVTVTLQYFKDHRPPTTGGSVTWQFTVE